MIGMQLNFMAIPTSLLFRRNFLHLCEIQTPAFVLFSIEIVQRVPSMTSQVSPAPNRM